MALEAVVPSVIETAVEAAVETSGTSSADALTEILQRLTDIQDILTAHYHWFVVFVLLAVGLVVAYFVYRPLLYFLSR